MQTQSEGRRLFRVLPIASWLPNLTADTIRADVAAGAALAAIAGVLVLGLLKGLILAMCLTLVVLEQLRNELKKDGIRLAFARSSDSVRGLLLRSGFLERLGEGRVFWGVDSAVDATEMDRSPASADVQ